VCFVGDDPITPSGWTHRWARVPNGVLSSNKK
jgi:hypothetical protein